MTEESVKLKDLLPKAALEVGEVKIPYWLAEQFRNRSNAQQTGLEASPKRFLETFITNRTNAVIEMIALVGKILSEAPPSTLEMTTEVNIDTEEDVWTHALVETQHWFSNQIVWGWNEDPFKRPEGHEMGSANGFFQSCLELVRHFLIDGGDPANHENIKKFIRENGEIVDSENGASLQLRWPGWEVYKPRAVYETIHLKRIKRSQRNAESLDDFFGRILADSAEETVIQMCMPDKEAYFESTTFSRKEPEEETRGVREVRGGTEWHLFEIMVGNIPYNDLADNLTRKVDNLGQLLGFLRKKTSVDRFMEDFADRALAAKKLSKKIN